jgi:NADH-quinone oxidoreductase subunit L
MHALWLIPILPLFGALFLALGGVALPRRSAGYVGSAMAGASWVVALIVAAGYLAAPRHGAFQQTLYTWLEVGRLHVPLGLYLDPLSLVMVLVVTFVGFLIHLYSIEFMAGDDGYPRFFCYLNLFLGAMLLLVLGDSLLSLYLGWEGVGLCSYFLIGFWYRDRANGRAARKAFLVTRIGDTALAIALFWLFSRLGTLDLQMVMSGVPLLGAAATTGIALLILAGAVGKSAQLPLHTWLPDAMAGPTPVSALIHAATMVTAGVYLVARTHVLFAASPLAMSVVAGIGIATALYAALCALAQRDLKRVLAYSTMSQVGYMFLALGVAAWSAALFHFMTHAFLKALLFLSAGIVIQALHEEHDLHRMGGMWRQLPVAGVTFLIGAASLSAFPLVTAGFYSKEAITAGSLAGPLGSPLLFGLALVGDVLTAAYIFRVFFLVFLGPATRELARRPGPLMKMVVIVLAVFSLVAGFVGVPAALGGYQPLLVFLQGSFGASPEHAGSAVGLVLSMLAPLLGIGLAYLLYLRREQLGVWEGRSPAPRALDRLFLDGGGFDWLYATVIVRPYQVLTRLNRRDVVDLLYTGLAMLAVMGNLALSAVESGRVRHYATALLLGALLVTALLVLR